MLITPAAFKVPDIIYNFYAYEIAYVSVLKHVYSYINGNFIFIYINRNSCNSYVFKTITIFPIIFSKKVTSRPENMKATSSS